ncbi:sugar phosphate isomerase/epimerase family protein [Pseudomonas gingeri]|uniref:Sugar phosphate isomerase/epimerase n=1 Tax=Pseudomonas gingeri TaxID=117681 RepID=A0A7Y8CK84_9PSED|nr:sugar phosphate isomerase/epimerase family protein [Pseudomonas gingeri]NVZ99115.1 sugar phosphate isomerase/epimerase [Pseudomonas gingeri]NWA13160.1 sugar phosphate isomerase/epimerase [Pseudomonas gingeri]NWA55421.1 sugar phosphate isomerase/epimerase [Pseudomonas gingeri]NWA95725.1 sugar phosphate isomerase/epimerase [Pseudomonas gingeri]NWB00813.1 sugar phosphate isomerase/epimerase [Pseudomonas gingeri]
MTTPNNILVLHSTVAKQSTLAMDIDIAKTVGFDALEINSGKLEAYLQAGYAESQLQETLKHVRVPGIGYLRDIERQGAERDDLLKEAERLFHLANLAGAKGVQVLTGPINVQAVLDFQRFGKSAHYSGLLGFDQAEQYALTAKNLAALADLAQQYDLLLYLEALSWTPLNSLQHQLQLIDRTERSNVRMVIDYWHCFTSGVTPDDIAGMNKDVIYGVHVCDSLPFAGGVPNEELLRDVPTGGGVLDLVEWTAAVKATGYVGWWSCELFCKKQQQQNSYEVARELKALLTRLVG